MREIRVGVQDAAVEDVIVLVPGMRSEAEEKVADHIGVGAVERREDQDLQRLIGHRDNPALLGRHDVQVGPEHATQGAEEPLAGDDDPPPNEDVAVAILGVDSHSGEILEQ